MVLTHENRPLDSYRCSGGHRKTHNLDLQEGGALGLVEGVEWEEYTSNVLPERPRWVDGRGLFRTLSL